MADYKRDDWIPVVPTLTPRERGVEKRLSEMEQVVSKIAKAVFTDDSMTTAVTNVVVDPVSFRVDALTNANRELNGVIEAKDAEIARLNDLLVASDARLDECYEEIANIYTKLRTHG